MQRSSQLIIFMYRSWRKNLDEKSLTIATGRIQRKMYNCNICTKPLIREANLRRHIKFVHEGVRNHKCKTCDKSFSHKSDLDVHMNSVHESNKNYKCAICQKTFSQNKTLMRHIRSLHNDREIHKLADRNCEVCGKLFKKMSFYNVKISDLLTVRLRRRPAVIT